jgi:large subunit ribosomal protein LP2
MKYLAASSLLALAGKDVTADSIKAVLSSVGAKIDEKELKSVADAVKGKNVNDLIAKGLPKVGSGAPSGAPSAPAPAPAKEEKGKKEEKPKGKAKEEPKVEEEEDFGGCGDLFG